MSEVLNKSDVENAIWLTSWMNWNYEDQLSMIAQATLKGLCGHYQGYTSGQIAEELGLLKDARHPTRKTKLTQKGKEFLFERFYDKEMSL